MSFERATSMAGLWSSLHILRIMANRGLVSPNEVETVNDSITEAMETLAPPDMAASLSEKISPVLAEVRQIASERWIGKGQTNPS
jgi:hypothetical protein